MKFSFVSFLFLSLAPEMCLGQTPGEHRSHQSGAFNSKSTWEQWDGTQWVYPAPETPTIASGPTTVLTGHTITASNNLTVHLLTVSTGSALIISPNRTIIINHTESSSADVAIFGSVILGGELVISDRTTVLIGEGASLSGTAPLASLEIAGTLTNSGAVDLTGCLLSLRDSARLQGPGLITTEEIIVSTGTDVLLDSPVICTSNFTVSGSSQVTVNQYITLEGSITIAGVFHSLSKVAIAGLTSLSGSGTKDFHDLVIGERASLIIDGNISLSGELTNEGSLIARSGTVLLTGDSTTLSGSSLTTNFNSLRVDTTAFARTALPIQVIGAMTVSDQGSFEAEEGTEITLYGNLSVTGAFQSKGVVVFADSTTITGTGSKVFDTITLAGVVTTNADYTITNRLIVVGGTLKPGTSTVTIMGDIQISCGAGSSVSFYNVTLPAHSPPFSLTSDCALTIIGATLRLNNGSFSSDQVINFARIGTTRITGTGPAIVKSFLVARGTTFRPNIPFMITGDMFVDGSMIAGNTVRFAEATHVLGNPVVLSLNNVVINPGGSFTSYSGPLTITGNFMNDGLFASVGGTIVFGGNTSKKISGTSLTEFSHVILNNGSAAIDLSLEGHANLTGVLTLMAGAQFDADGLTGSGIFTLLSTGDSPTSDAAIAALPNGATIAGNVTVQRYVSIEGPNNNRIYRYISSPVSGATVTDLQHEIPVTGVFTGHSACSGCGMQPSMFWYDESDPSTDVQVGYQPFPTSANSESLHPGLGYALFVRGNIDPLISAGSARYDLRGPINSGSINYPVTYTASRGNQSDGWNLVGNPYPSAIDWNAGGWSKINIGGAIYLKDNGVNPSRYAVWNGVTGINGGSSTIAEGQGFFVHATGPSPALISDESVKTTADSVTYFRVAQPPRLLRMALISGEHRDEAVIHFKEGATEAVDFEADALKLTNTWSTSVPFLNLSTLSPRGLQKLAINTLPYTLCQVSVALDVSDVPAGLYSLEFSNVQSFLPDITVVLKDAYARGGRDVRLSGDQNYRFEVTTDSLSFGSSRFRLVFIDQNRITSAGARPFCAPVILGESNHDLPTPRRSYVGYPNPVKDVFTLELNGQHHPSTFPITDLLGVEVGRMFVVNGGSRTYAEFDFSHLPSGIYFINSGAGVLRVVKE